MRATFAWLFNFFFIVSNFRGAERETPGAELAHLVTRVGILVPFSVSAVVALGTMVPGRGRDDDMNEKNLRIKKLVK